METNCFVTQEATESILLRVTNVCHECYSDLHVGDTIYYDMTQCRYLCQSCQQVLAEKLNENCEIEEGDENATLF
jgi:hypothetical protein